LIKTSSACPRLTAVPTKSPYATSLHYNIAIAFF
jgi:hypothetical protein